MIHLWQLKTVVFLHWCLIHAVLLANIKRLDKELPTILEIKRTYRKVGLPKVRPTLKMLKRIRTKTKIGRRSMLEKISDMHRFNSPGCPIES